MASRQFIVIVDILRIAVQWCPVRTGCICILRTIGSEINKQCRATRPVLIDRNSFWISPSFCLTTAPRLFLSQRPNVERSLSFVSLLKFLSCLKRFKTSVFPFERPSHWSALSIYSYFYIFLYSIFSKSIFIALHFFCKHHPSFIQWIKFNCLFAANFCALALSFLLGLRIVSKVETYFSPDKVYIRS